MCCVCVFISNNVYNLVYKHTVSRIPKRFSKCICHDIFFVYTQHGNFYKTNDSRISDTKF